MNPCIECCSPSKYKCPICRQPYCSVTCCKKHKEVLCIGPENEELNTEPVDKNKTDYEFATEDTVPVDKLNQLEASMELKKCLADPYLRTMLAQLDQAKHPDEMIQDYMLQPLFTEFVDKCLKIVQTDTDE